MGREQSSLVCPGAGRTAIRSEFDYQPGNDPEQYSPECQVWQIRQLQSLVQDNVCTANGQEGECAEVEEQGEQAFDLAADGQDNYHKREDDCPVAVYIG